jgi:hypothetical protein
MENAALPPEGRRPQVQFSAEKAVGCVVLFLIPIAGGRHFLRGAGDPSGQCRRMA